MHLGFAILNTEIKSTYGYTSSLLGCMLIMKEANPHPCHTHDVPTYDDRHADSTKLSASLLMGEASPPIYYLPLYYNIIAKLEISPRLGNQLGGTAILIRGRCIDPGFIICVFNVLSNFNVGRLVNKDTVLCSTPIMNTQGPVEVELRHILGRNFATIASGTFNAGILDT